MAENATAFSAPQRPPEGYEGPSIGLHDEQGQELAQLYIDRDQVVIETTTYLTSAGTVPGVLSVLSELIGPCQVRALAADRPWATQPIHGVLLLAVASCCPEFICPDRERYHLTLAYALPLALDTRWRVWCENHLEEVIGSSQLVAVPATNLVAVQPHQDLARRHRRLLGIHRETVVTEHRDTEHYLRDWCRFSNTRYGQVISQNEFLQWKNILLMSDCSIRDVIYNGDTIGRSVVCLHEPSRTLFDLMATWEPSAARLRPGIFSGVHNILDAFRRGVRYSLCYGQFPYKDEIVGPSSRLTLRDLLNP